MKLVSKTQDYNYLEELERRISNAFHGIDPSGAAGSQSHYSLLEGVCEEFAIASSAVQNFRNYVMRNPAVIHHLKMMSDAEAEMDREGIRFTISKGDGGFYVAFHSFKHKKSLGMVKVKPSFIECMVDDGIEENSTGFWLTFAGHFVTGQKTLAVIAYRQFKESRQGNFTN